ncbi:DUF4832 domain-containing protein [Roseateles sp. DC23W]|uniref:DUF4832 domain-containing protein n=1 Tax=Pelomonas dachongensis TaxID=3299029 RepID=A0ABW7EI51_9BURK
MLYMRPCPLPRTLAGAFGSMLLAALPATATAVPLVSNLSGACLEAKVDTWDIRLATCNASALQDFTLTPVGSGGNIVTLKNAQANLCVAATGTSGGSFVELGTCQSTQTGQRFQAVALAGGATSQLKLAANNLCLTAPATVGQVGFSVATCNTANANQAWRLGGATPPPAPPAAGTVETSFTVSTAEIANPERGMYVWAADNLLLWTQAEADSQFQEGYRVVYAPVRLDAYATTTLPASLLTQLSERFAIARRAGLKLVPRFLYNYPENETEYRNVKDAPLARVLSHIDQLKPVLAANADVIAYLQAGFIGAWGEWHTSSNNLTAVSPRTQIRDALLAALPTERFLQLRYPAYLMAWAPQVPSWRDGSAASRIGAHNDCFLASTTDVGTYSDNTTTRQTERNYIAALSRVAPFGGETCNPADEQNPTPRTSCADILAEGRQFNLTYLNNSYYREIFHTRWEQQGCLAEVRRSLGYRFELATLRHTAAVTAGQSGELLLTVKNSGWARAFNPRAVQLLLKHKTSGAVVRIALPAVDPRSWLPTTTSTVSAGFTVPVGTPTGAYDVLLALPDGAVSLSGDVRYSVRLANADDTARAQNWDAALGAFRAGTTLTVR